MLLISKGTNWLRLPTTSRNYAAQSIRLLIVLMTKIEYQQFLFLYFLQCAANGQVWHIKSIELHIYEVCGILLLQQSYLFDTCYHASHIYQNGNKNITDIIKWNRITSLKYHYLPSDYNWYCTRWCRWSQS